MFAVLVAHHIRYKLYPFPNCTLSCPVPSLNSFGNRFIQIPSSIHAAYGLKVPHRFCKLCFSTTSLRNVADVAHGISAEIIEPMKSGSSSLVLDCGVIKKMQCECESPLYWNSITLTCAFTSLRTFSSITYSIRAPALYERHAHRC